MICYESVDETQLAVVDVHNMLLVEVHLYERDRVGVDWSYVLTVNFTSQSDAIRVAKAWCGLEAK